MASPLLPSLILKKKVTDIIPIELEDCVIQLNQYFEGTRKAFNIKLNPTGTDFQKKSLEATRPNSFRKNYFIFRIIKTVR